MTTPPQLDRLREIAAARRRLDDEEAEILDALASTQPARLARPARRPGRMIDVARAAKIAGRGTSWIYSNGPRFGFAWRLASGSWTVDESLLRAFLHGEHENREDREHREADEIPLLAAPPYLPMTKEGER